MTLALEDAVTLACLSAEPGSRPARALKELLAAAAQPNLLDALPDALGYAAADRPGRLARARTFARTLLARADRAGLRPIPWWDDVYPPLLKEIVDPPILLWSRGDLTYLSHPAVAIVGSRAGTPTGLKIARQIAEALAAAGVVVVSGLARGVDAAGHEGALDGGGATIAVLGCGADVLYPPEHGRLADRVAAKGLLLSEFSPGASPEPHHFPLRNRIISGLSRAVVVIEAGDKSGSLITARMALEQGRDVMAVPGNVLSGRSRGCHALIKDGARLVEGVEDVLQELGWAAPAENTSSSDSKALLDNGLRDAMAAGEPYSLDQLETMTGKLTGELLASLTSLELAGVVSRLPGGYFVRLDVRC